MQKIFLEKNATSVYYYFIWEKYMSAFLFLNKFELSNGTKIIVLHRKHYKHINVLNHHLKKELHHQNYF